MNFSSQTLQQFRLKKIEQDSKCRRFQLDIQELQYKTQKPSVKMNHERIKITLQDFVNLIDLAKSILLKQPSLLKLQSPLIVSTGTLGHYTQLANIFDKCGNPKFVNYLFIGDYTGRYDRSIECLVALLVYKIKFPQNFFILRGCYQSIKMSKMHNLYKEIIEYFDCQKPWLKVCELFCCLPFAATINNKIFVVHGGLSQYLVSIEQINMIKRPYDTPQSHLPYELIHSCISYKTNQQYQQDQQETPSFDKNQVHTFLKRNNLQLICRGHQLSTQGFQFAFDRKLVTITSLSNYLGYLFNNSAVMLVEENGGVTFKIIQAKFTTLRQEQNQENQQKLTFKEIIENREKKEIQLEKIKKQQEKLEQQYNKEKEKHRMLQEEQEIRKKKKQEKLRMKRLKKEMIKEQKEKEILKKFEESQMQSIFKSK